MSRLYEHPASRKPYTVEEPSGLTQEQVEAICAKRTGLAGCHTVLDVQALCSTALSALERAETAETEARELRVRLERVQPYIEHMPHCEDERGECICGLDAALKEAR